MVILVPGTRPISRSRRPSSPATLTAVMVPDWFFNIFLSIIRLTTAPLGLKEILDDRNGRDRRDTTRQLNAREPRKIRERHPVVNHLLSASANRQALDKYKTSLRPHLTDNQPAKAWLLMGLASDKTDPHPQCSWPPGTALIKKVSCAVAEKHVVPQQPVNLQP